MLPRSKAPALLIAIALVIGVVAILIPRMPQPLDYDNFADHRAWLGIPNFGDVVSNLAFAIVGIWGITILISPKVAFEDPRERWPYAIAFAGMILTAVGSAYYHLAPDNARLVWDRLPMTVVFMSLISAMIVERISVGVGLWLLPVLLVIGATSVLQWRASELEGHGDLRFYAAVQVSAVVVLLVMLLVRPKYTRTADFAVVVGLYVVAKLLEETDRPIFRVGHVVSGHTLKHLAAALAGFWILRMLERRKAIPA